MKVIWKGKTEFLALTNGKEYTVLSIEKGWYRLIDDSGEDYLYPPENFGIVDKFTSNALENNRPKTFVDEGMYTFNSIEGKRYGERRRKKKKALETG